MSASAGACAIVYQLAPAKDSIGRLSFGSAYTAVTLLAITLTIGPINALRGLRVPVSSDLRRDVGIWCCLWSLIHTAFGLQVHLRGRMLEYFFYPGTGPLVSRLRFDLFGAANYTGLVAALLVVVLGMLSNDVSLRLLGARNWKRIQKVNCILFALAIAHAVLYQLVENRRPPYAFAIGFLAAMVIAMQCARGLLRGGTDDRLPK